MATVKATDWFKVQGWMVSDLRLSGWELVIFAIVYTFASSDACAYKGGIRLLMRWTGLSRNTVRECLRDLEKRGLIVAHRGDMDGVPSVSFTIGGGMGQPLTHTGQQLTHTGQPLTGDGSTTDPGMGQPLTPEHNKEHNKEHKKKSIKEDFDFLGALLGLGVTQKTATDWLAVRRKKGGVNTETAFNAVAREIAKSGKTAEECIALSAANSWIGFKAEYLKNETNNRYRIVTYGKQ